MIIDIMLCLEFDFNMTNFQNLMILALTTLAILFQGFIECP